MVEPFIVISAPNGARRQKTDHPDLPITPTEIAACAEEIVAAGASVLHLHVRDNNNQHSLDVDRYRASIKAIRDVVGEQLIIQVTSEAVGKYNSTQQMGMIKELKPEAVSLALRELCPADADITEAAKFFSWLRSEKIFPQYILYDQKDCRRFEDYCRRGIFVDDNPFVLFVVGRAGTDIQREKIMTDIAKGTSNPWAVCGFGVAEISLVSFAAEHSGHIRVGFENNIHNGSQQLLSGHGEMIDICQQAANKTERKIATADNVRNLFSL
ncbi:MAG: 3-keto-5-aminohexanoate cleavage protein [Robiginitomaculum sp.]|nr:3-keto-5-aminohexanoate cleavage protein [Robiginitomaculum sp.]